MNEASPPTIADRLAPLLQNATDTQTTLGAETAERLDTCWRELTQLGFEIEVNSDEIRVRHTVRGFKITIQLSRPDDLGELRNLFLTLRRHFGRTREQTLPWLFLPGATVTVPYEHLRTIIATCQQLRQGGSRDT